MCLQNYSRSGYDFTKTTRKFDRKRLFVAQHWSAVRIFVPNYTERCAVSLRQLIFLYTFPRIATHLSFLPRDARSASAVLLSYVVRPSVRLSVTLTYRGHIGSTSSKIITRIISLGSSLLRITTSAI